MPARRRFIRERKLNELIPGDLDEIGVVIMGGLTNSLLRRRAAGSRRHLRAPLGCRFWSSNVGIRWCRRSSAASAVREARRAGGRGGHPNTSSTRSTWNCAAPSAKPGCSARVRCPRPANNTAEVLLNGCGLPREVPPARLDPELIVARMRDRRPSPQGGGVARRIAGTAHRRSAPAVRSGRVQRHQAGQRRSVRPTSVRHRCHSFRHAAAVQPRATRSSATACRSRAPRGRSQHGPALHAHDTDGGFWHNGLIHRVASNLSPGRRHPHRDAERLHLGDRPAIYALPARRGAAARRPAWMCETTLRSMGVNGCAKSRTTRSPP